MEISRSKNVATRIVFPLIDSALRPKYRTSAITSLAVTGYSWQDGQAAATLAISGTPAQLGATGLWELALTQAEMNPDTGADDYIILKITGTEIDEQTVLIRVKSKEAVVTAMATGVISSAIVANGALTAAKFGDDVAIKAIRTGTATGGAAQTITLDVGASAVDNFYCGTQIQIVSGTGAGQGRSVAAYVGSTKVATLSNAWVTNPSSDSVFVVSTIPCPMGVMSRGFATAGAASTITMQTGETWGTNFLTGASIRIVTGTGVGQIRSVSSNTNATPSVITVDRAWAANPDTTSLYELMAVSDSQITALDVADNTIAAAKIASNAIAAAKIASGAITNAKFAAGAIDAAAIATGAITNAKFAAGAIDAAAIATGAIDADAIAADAIGASEFAQAAADKVWDTAARALTAVADANLVQIDGQVTTGNNATLNLKQLNVVNSAGSAIVATGGSNGNGIASTGQGTGAGIATTGGANGNGLTAIAGTCAGIGIAATGAPANPGIRATGGTDDTTIGGAGIEAIGGAGTNTAAGGSGLKTTGGSSSAAAGGSGMLATGNGSGAGLQATGGQGGHGIAGIGGSSTGSGVYGKSTSLDGIQGVTDSSSGSGIRGLATTGDSHGIRGDGVGSGDGIHAEAGATGHGVNGVGGATSGNGIKATAQAGNSDGIKADGQGSGNGVAATGGATGNGIKVLGGATSGNGINATAQASNGEGILATGYGSGDGIHATGGATGNGLHARGGANSGSGILAEGYGIVAASDGIKATGINNGIGLNVVGNGTGPGLKAKGGVTGHGIEALGGATSGNGINATALAGNSNGVLATGDGSGAGIVVNGGVSGDAITATAGASSNGSAVKLQGYGTGHGLETTGGVSGHGVKAVGGGLGGNGILSEGTGAGAGMKVTGGATGDGLVLTQGAGGSKDIAAYEIDAIKAKTDTIPASPASVGSAMTLADDAITASKFDESTAFPLKNADAGSTTVARTGADGDTLKTLSDQVDGVQTSVDSIQNNTRFVGVVPSTMLIPSASTTMYKISVNFYDTDGNMEDPDANEIDVLYENVTGVDKDAFFDDAAGTTPATVGVIDANMWQMVRIGVGVYETFYKLPSTETVSQWIASFKLNESATLLQYVRSTDLFATAPGSTTLADNTTNKDVIAKALKERDVSGTSAVTGSVYDDIMDNVDAVDTSVGTVDGKVDDILADTNEVQGKLPTNKIMGSSDVDNHDTDIDAILVDTNEVQGKLPTNKIMGSSDVDNHDTDIDDILADTNEIQGKLPTNKIMGSSDVDNHDTDIDAILVDTADMQPKLGTLVDLGDGATIAENLTAIAGKTTDAASYNRATDSLEAISDSTSGASWSATERANIRHALGVDGTKTVPTGGYGRLGAPVTADLATDIINVQATANNVETDTQDIQSKIGAPAGGSVATAVAGVQSDTDDIQTKIGSPAGGSVATAIAGVQSDTDDIQIKIGAPAGGSVATAIAGVQSDTDDIQTKIGSPAGGSVAVAVAAVKTVVDAVEVDTQDLQSKLGTPVDLGDGATVAEGLTALAGKTADAASYDRTTDSQEAIRDSSSGASWSATERENIRHALGVDGTKTAPTGGYGRLGSPAGASLSADVAAVQSDTDDIQTKIGAPAGGSVATAIAGVQSDTDDIQTKIGSPAGGSVATAIAGVQSDTDDIQTKIGSPVANVATDIAAVKTVVDSNQTKLTTITGVDGTKLATLQPNYAPSKAGDQMALVNDAITAGKFDETTAYPLLSADTGATQVARIGADGDTLKTISDQVDGVQTSVDGIQNNTRFVGTVPDTMILPAAGTSAKRIVAHFYDTAGNMEDPDANEIATIYKNVAGTSKTAFTDDAAGLTPATASITFPGTYKMVRLSVGVYETYYQLPSTEAESQWIAEFTMKEATIVLNYTRSSNVLASPAGTVTLANSPANKLIVAEGVLATPANKLATDSSGRVDISKWAGSAVGIGASSGLPAVDSQAISDNIAAADAVQANIGKLDVAISTVNGKVDIIDTNVDTLITKVNTIDSNVDVILDNTDNIEAKVDIIDTNVDSILVDTNSIEAKVDIIDTNVDAIKVKTEQLAFTSGNVHSDIKQYNTVPDVTINDTSVDKVWDEAIAGHLTAGSTGKALNDSATALDWTTAEKNQIRSALGVDGTKTAATGGQLQSVQTDVNDIETLLNNGGMGLGAIKTAIDDVQTTTDAIEVDTQDIQSKIGTPANIDGGGANIASNLKKFADDNGGTVFDATYNSLKAIKDSQLSFTNNEKSQMKNALGMDNSGTSPVGGDLQDVMLLATAIKAITDMIPNDGAMTSIAKEATLGDPIGASIVADIQSVLTALGVTDARLTNPTTGLAAIKTAVGSVSAQVLAETISGSATFLIAMKKILSYCACNINRIGASYTYRNFDNTGDEMMMTGSDTTRIRS